MMITIPDGRRGDALDDVAHQRPAEIALVLGASAPALVQACVDLARRPDVYAQHPRACRVILERIERARAARSAQLLNIRVAV